MMEQAWRKGIASRKNPFDESIEITWTEQWLFFANSIRYASAMAGAPDYAAFHNGWWDMQKAMEELREAVHMKEAGK
jgi:hydroxylamine dehydrogenase